LLRLTFLEKNALENWIEAYKGEIDPLKSMTSRLGSGLPD